MLEMSSLSKMPSSEWHPSLTLVKTKAFFFSKKKKNSKWVPGGIDKLVFFDHVKVYPPAETRIIKKPRRLREWLTYSINQLTI